MTGHRYLKLAMAILLILPVLCSRAGALEIPVAVFSKGDVSGWEEKVFAGNTVYRVAQAEGRNAMGAAADGAASGFFKKVSIDLRQTPYLHWSWLVRDVFHGNDERSKQGDDFPARVYVVVSGGVFFWRTRALNFVWSSHQAVGQAWPNPFTGNAIMVAVDAGTDHLGQWREHKIDVRQALRQHFGKDIASIDAVAIMTDADNHGGKAQAYYGDIYFSDN